MIAALAMGLGHLEAQTPTTQSPEKVVDTLLKSRHGLRDLSPDKQDLLEDLRSHPAFYKGAVSDAMQLPSNNQELPSHEDLRRVGGALGLAKQLGAEHGSDSVRKLFDETSTLWQRVKDERTTQTNESMHKRNELLRALRANALDVLSDFDDVSAVPYVLTRVMEEDIATVTVMLRYLEKVAPLRPDVRPRLEAMYNSPDSPLRNHPQLLRVLEAMDKAKKERGSERRNNREGAEEKDE
jgi:hypothetical protein